MYYFCIRKLCGSLVHVLLSYVRVARHSSRAAEVYFAIFVLKSCGFRAGAAKVYFVYYLCDECSENSPAKVPRWGPRKLMLSREDGGFRNKGFQTTVVYIIAYADLRLGPRVGRLSFPQALCGPDVRWMCSIYIYTIVRKPKEYYWPAALH